MVKQTIAITGGEPAGVGPDLLVLMSQMELKKNIVVIADRNLLADRAKKLNVPLDIIPYHANDLVGPHQPGTLVVQHVPVLTSVTPGKLEAANSHYVIATLARAAQGCLDNEFSAVVTNSVHKGIINAAGIDFLGQTEFFAEYSHAEHVVMLVMNKLVRIALLTTHIPLRAVSDAITSQLLSATIKIVDEGLQTYFGLKQPCILICGLNPHAGENGQLGREEIDIITPTLDELRAADMNLIGPVAADTAYLDYIKYHADVMLAMYHDQGISLLKNTGFDEAVNVTLGLPFIRISVEHGPGFEFAGTTKVNTKSFFNAIDVVSAFIVNSRSKS